MKRSSTAAEKRHMAAVASMGCICCELIGYAGTPAQVHHVRTKHGWGRSSHFDTIPLCERHHTGQTGVHTLGRDEFAAHHGYSEIEMLAIVRERIGN